MSKDSIDCPFPFAAGSAESAVDMLPGFDLVRIWAPAGTAATAVQILEAPGDERDRPPAAGAYSALTDVNGDEVFIRITAGKSVTLPIDLARGVRWMKLRRLSGTGITWTPLTADGAQTFFVRAVRRGEG